MCGTSWARRPHCGPFSSKFSRDPEAHAWGGGWFMRHGHDDEGFGRSGPFGIRRPLRFLAHKLDLNEQQITQLARILDELKTERAQAEVDDRRSLSDFADALGGEAFDAVKAAGAGDRRTASATRLRDAVVRALQQIHALLNPDQRGRLAYLIRAGILSL